MRIIPKGKEGDMIEFGGLGEQPQLRRSIQASSAAFIARGGQIPAPIHALVYIGVCLNRPLSLCLAQSSATNKPL